jgi:penicillin amidase
MLFTLLGLVPLLVVTAFGVLWLTVPSDDQTLRILGLTAPVEITLDGNSVPRIRAASDHDAAIALGFIHARDRMFQMELMRRLGSGRLSELAGSVTLGTDKFMRVLGLARLAADDLAAQSPDARALLEAYAIGVNAWIRDRGRFAALEFLLFGEPEPWRPADSLMWGRLMGLQLSTNYRTELLRQSLRGKVPQRTLEELWPPHPTALPADAGLIERDGQPPRSGPMTLFAAQEDRRAAAAANALLAAIPAFPAPFTGPSTASNEWAVDGRFSETGAPLLAGDPHLGFEFPSLWYLVRIDTPDRVLAGATAPGVPFLVLGRNSRIAWSFTTTGADTQDVYLEPPEARFTSHQERIKVRGQPDVLLSVRETRHGPVISDLTQSTADTPAMAVAMENLQPGDTAATGLLALNRAGTVEAAGTAAAQITSPVQNLMVADRTKVALFVTGRVPIRREGDGWAPVPGKVSAETGPPTDDAYGWTGHATGDALPHFVAPSSGRLVNTNESVAPPEFPVFLGRDTFRDWRSQRARTLLDSAATHSTSDFAAMQVDPVSTYAAALLPTLRVVTGAPRVLQDWDGAMMENAPQPLIFSAWMQEFHHAVLRRAGLAPSASAPIFEFVPFVLSPQGASWCGGDCAPLLKATLDATMARLSERFGADPAKWRWGAVHQAVFAHPLFRAIPVLGALTTQRIAVPGDGTTLDRGGTNEALEAVHGASYRGVYDLADLDRSLYIMTPGQSGNPLSRHARDFLTRWRDGAMVLLGQRATDAIGVIRLTP